MRTHKKIAALLALLMMTPAFCQSLDDHARKDEIVFMQDEEPAMRDAFQKAKATLDDFLKKAKNPPAGTDGYAIKVGVRDGEDTEYFWLNELKFTGSTYAGRINNEPEIVENVSYGQMYSFTRDQIVDWMYMDNKKSRMMGNFTACALLTKESPDNVKKFKEQYGLLCD